MEETTKGNGTEFAYFEGKLIYSRYLQLGKILNAQQPLSGKLGKQIHEEHLFIITHQAYELWFKQILYELDSVTGMCTNGALVENMLKVTSRLNRVEVILQILIQQIGVLETMTPSDFLEFRGYLSPASGFQSIQFRFLENKLGVRKNLRMNYAGANYKKAFIVPEELKAIEKSEGENSLADAIQTWLENTPGLEENGFNFWAKYKDAWQTILQQMKKKYEECENDRKSGLLKEYEYKEKLFETVFNEEKHNELVEKGERRLSHKAFRGLIMITLYQDEARFHQSFTLLNRLMNIDSSVMKWRFHHSQMVLRMIGSKLQGTGGSSGYHYLFSTIRESYKVFPDLFNISTYLIPRNKIPSLTDAMKRRLSFNDAKKE